MKWEDHWYRFSLTPLTLLLLPFAWIFYGIVRVRRFLYRVHVKKSVRFSKPIIVVGNITVGGTGKTPFVIWLALFLRSRGWRPGIVTRGYSGVVRSQPYWVKIDSDPHTVGDEAVVLARRAQSPVVVSANRVAAVKELLANTTCDVVIADDGLQHYRLARDIEIAVIDGARDKGNGYLLPAGPLREPISRLQETDFIVRQGEALAGEYAMQLLGTELVGVAYNQQRISLTHFYGKTVHAVAGIGHPQRFFSLLRAQGIQVIEHAFPDHYFYKAADLFFTDSFPILMTEKDAVKCQEWADLRCWYLPVIAEVDAALGSAILMKLIKGEKPCKN